MPSLLSTRISACLLLGIPVIAAAEPTQTAMLSEMEYLGEMPVVLTVSRLAQPIAEAPGAVTVIDREMIKASGFREIPDLFRLVPGFYVGRFDGTSATVNHGLSDQYSRRMQVLVDGRSIYTPLFGGVDWSDLPLAMDDIERIEVIRGPNAASYGANSFMGIINIITRHAAEDKGAYVSMISGDKGVGQGTVRYGGKSGNLDYRLTLGYREDAGFGQKYDSQRSQYLSFRGDYALNPADDLQVQLGYNVGERGVGFANDELNQPRDYQIDSHFEQLRWARVLDSNNEFSLQFYHNYHKSSDSFTTIAYPYRGGSTIINSAVLSSTVLAERFDLEFQHILSPMRDVRIVWGVGARLDQVNAPFYFNTGDTQAVHMKRVFGNAEWRMMPGMILNLGAMVENHDLTGTDVSPRLAFNYAFVPNHTLRASVSKALRMPVLLEERADNRLKMPITYLGLFSGTWDYPIAKGAGSLLPEKIVSQEIGYIGEYKSLGVTTDFRLFRDRITDFISNHGITTNSYLTVSGITQSVGVNTASFANQNDATMGGTEMQVRYRVTPDSQLIFTHSYTHTTSSDADNNVLSRTTPVHNFGLLGMHSLGDSWYGSFGYYKVGGLEALGWSTPVDAYQRLDLRLARRFKAGVTRGEFSVVLQNVLGDYNDFRNDNVFDRRGYMNLTLDF